jgi:hypothetical protein
MEDRDWALGDIVWAFLGIAIVLGLMALNSYIQKLARDEEERRIALVGSELQTRHRSIDSQSRRPDDI